MKNKQPQIKGFVLMEKLTVIILMSAVVFRLMVLYIFPQSNFLKQFSLLIFVAVMIAAIIILIWKWLRWRNFR